MADPAVRPRTLTGAAHEDPLLGHTQTSALPSLRALQEEGHVVVCRRDTARSSGGAWDATCASGSHQGDRSGRRHSGAPAGKAPGGRRSSHSLRELDPELSVVAAFGEILTDEVLALPTHGSINVHASLLPELRGAAPVNWAIIRGPRTFRHHDHADGPRELDAGPVLYRVAVELATRTSRLASYTKCSRRLVRHGPR